MSHKNKGKVFPILSPENTALILGEILQEIYGGSPPTIKAIAALTSADLKTIKNWYAGRNVPHLSHFLELCVSDPVFLCAILRQTGYDILAGQLELSRTPDQEANEGVSLEVYSIIFDPINGEKSLDLVRQLNIRQVWFYGELKNGHATSMNDLMCFWDVGEATAKRDLSELIRLGLIRHVGSKRNGYYSL